MEHDVQLRAQTILYGNDLSTVERSVQSLANAVRISREQDGLIRRIQIAFGDASPTALADADWLPKLERCYGEYIEFSYTFFGFNSGTSKGQNLLFRDCAAEYLMLYNPDIVVSPTYFLEMFKPYLEREDGMQIGMVEARQTPLEHPKTYDFNTMEEAWGAMACVVVPSSVYRELDGLDEKNLFLYCDDVDFSWRIRLSGRKVVYAPNAVAFHGHRLNAQGRHCVTQAELYYSAEAALIMAYKWSNDALLNKWKSAFAVGTEYQKRALKVFSEREKNNDLPQRLDKQHRIASFYAEGYSRNRF